MNGTPSLDLLRSVEDRASWLAVWQVYYANHKPRNEGQKPKVGGHQASVTSSSTLLSALYLAIKRPQDRIAVKPHAAPFLYSLMYLMGKLTRDQMENLREFGGLQPYPTQHTNPEFVDYSTSIEGLGVAAVIEDAYVAQVQRDQLGRPIDAVYHGHVGDGELTELQIGGSLYEAGRRRLGNVRWWVDLNRQSLDRIMEDSPHGSTAAWARRLFEANGWNVIELRWGARALEFFSRPGGEILRARLEGLTDAQLQPLLLLPGDVVRRALVGQTTHADPAWGGFLADFARAAPVEGAAANTIGELLSGLTDEQVKGLVEDVGGHDLSCLLDAARRADGVTHQPTAIICHTIKGWRLPGWAGHPENHGAILSSARLEEYRRRLGAPEGDPLATFDPASPEGQLLAERAERLFPPSVTRPMPYRTDLLPAPGEVRVLLGGTRSTSAVFGQLNTTYLKSKVGPYLHFVAPDVGLTTHLGGVITQTGVYDHNEEGVNLTRFLIEKKQAPFAWRLSRKGQFHSVAINEGVAAMRLFAFGRRHYEAEGKEQLFVVGTIYDIFWKHAYTQVFYGVYDGARYMAVGTPSGTSLSRESGTHQSIQTPAIMMDLPGIVAYEPAYALDTAVIYHEGLAQMGEPEGESIYLRLTTQELLQPVGEIDDAERESRGLPALAPLPTQGEEGQELRRQIFAGAYWLHHPVERGGAAPPDFRPGVNVVHLYATGPVMEEALRASRRLLEEHGIWAPVLNVTSWDRLRRGWRQHWSDPERWTRDDATYHLSALISDAEWAVPTVVVLDGSPTQADWISSALGRPVRTLGPTTFSEVGAVPELRAHHQIDADAVVRAALAELAAG